MANVRKRILQLTALESASLNTTIVGVDGGTTYRIELDTLADAVTSRVNILDRDRLTSLESVTSSFEPKGRNIVSGSSQLTSSYDTRYVVSGSITQTTWDNISGKPNGLVSQSTDLSHLNSFTSSQSTLNTAFTNGISARLQTSSFNEYTASISTGSLVNRLNAIESVSGSWITESETGSFLTSLSGAISSSAQITTFGFVSGSYETTGRGIISSSANLVTTSSFNSYTASISTASLVTSISNLNSATSSYLTSLSGAISSSSQLTSSFDTRYAISASFVSSSNVLSMRTITSASYAALTPVSGTLYIIIG
jgi:hypothetical protein